MSSEKLVYLAGPISGLSYGQCTGWREEAMAALAQHGITGISPMRAKEYLSHLHDISSDGRDYAHLGVFATPRGVITRDRYDCMRCGVLLVNLLGAQRVSVGSVMEMAWADAKRTPIVCVMEREGNPHDHMMFTEVIGFRVETLEEALHVVKVILR